MPHTLPRTFALATLIDTTVAWWLMLGIEASRGNKARRLLSMTLAMRRCRRGERPPAVLCITIEQAHFQPRHLQLRASERLVIDHPMIFV
jgi:hypothetical protein